MRTKRPPLPPSTRISNLGGRPDQQRLPGVLDWLIEWNRQVWVFEAGFALRFAAEYRGEIFRYAVMLHDAQGQCVYRADNARHRFPVDVDQTDHIHQNGDKNKRWEPFYFQNATEFIDKILSDIKIIIGNSVDSCDPVRIEVSDSIDPFDHEDWSQTDAGPG